MSSGKAPCADSISTEVYAAGGPQIDRKSNRLSSMWTQGTLPQALKDASIIHLWKRKRNRNVCDNHHGISMLSIVGKILARIMLNRLNAHLERDLIPEGQCGFRAGLKQHCRYGIDSTPITRKMSRTKCRSVYHLHRSKSFDTMSREGLRAIMANFRCPPPPALSLLQWSGNFMTAWMQECRMKAGTLSRSQLLKR